jgi:hypothetical protein
MPSSSFSVLQEISVVKRLELVVSALRASLWRGKIPLAKALLLFFGEEKFSATLNARNILIIHCCHKRL